MNDHFNIIEQFHIIAQYKDWFNQKLLTCVHFYIRISD